MIHFLVVKFSELLNQISNTCRNPTSAGVNTTKCTEMYNSRIESRFMYRLGMPQDPHMRTMHGWIELVLEGHETTQLQGRAQIYVHQRIPQDPHVRSVHGWTE